MEVTVTLDGRQIINTSIKNKPMCGCRNCKLASGQDRNHIEQHPMAKLSMDSVNRAGKAHKIQRSPLFLQSLCVKGTGKAPRASVQHANPLERAQKEKPPSPGVLFPRKKHPCNPLPFQQRGRIGPERIPPASQEFVILNIL